jgi:hypothetical protein
MGSDGPMRFYVEPSPAGGYHVKLDGSPAPISHHDTEEEAEARRQAYARGAAFGAAPRPGRPPPPDPTGGRPHW